MKKINVETLVPNNFNYLARDLDGTVFAFEDKPELPVDIACDTWDIATGEVLKITESVSTSEEKVSFLLINEELGDWRDSLTEINSDVLT